MSSKYYGTNQFGEQIKLDTGMGLVYRLNQLMRDIENYVIRGDSLKWSFCIDRIFVNICYKDPLDILKDDKGNVINFKVKKTDIQIFTIFQNKVEAVKREMTEINSSNLDDEDKKAELFKLRNKLYGIILQKDLWIRKLLYELKLYLKSEESEPQKAIYR